MQLQSNRQHSVIVHYVSVASHLLAVTTELFYDYCNKTSCTHAVVDQIHTSSIHKNSLEYCHFFSTFYFEAISCIETNMYFLVHYNYLASAKL